jgi:hypothetical protein
MDPEVNGHVSLQSSWDLWDSNQWFLENKSITWPVELHPSELTTTTFNQQSKGYLRGRNKKNKIKWIPWSKATTSFLFILWENHPKAVYYKP